MKRIIASLLILLIVFSSNFCVVADEQLYIEFDQSNSIIAQVVCETQRTFSSEDFPEIDCTSVFMISKRYNEEKDGWDYQLILVCNPLEDGKINQVIDNILNNPLVLSATINRKDEFKNCYYQLNQDSIQLKIGEKYVLSVQKVVLPKEVVGGRTVWFSFDESKFTDREKEDFFAELGVDFYNTMSGGKPGKYSYCIDENKVEFPFEIINRIANHSEILEMSYSLEMITGSYGSEGVWSCINDQLLTETPTDISNLSPILLRNPFGGKCTIVGERPGTAIVKITNNPRSYITGECKVEVLNEYYSGNVNKDYAVDAKDALEVLKASVNKVVLTKEQEKLADVNCDNRINAIDALEILRYAVK